MGRIVVVARCSMRWRASFPLHPSACRCLAEVPLRLQTTPPIVGRICAGLCWSKPIGVQSLILTRSFFECGGYGTFVVSDGTLPTTRVICREPRRVDPTRPTDSTRFVRLYIALPSRHHTQCRWRGPPLLHRP
jgi:hypothetical protein